MADYAALAVVRTALAIRAHWPEVAALQVLDRAMEQDHYTNPDFSAANQPFTDWLSPASPFAPLLRDAFAPQIGDSELAQAQRHGGDPPALPPERWQQTVVARFKSRYHLGEP